MATPKFEVTFVTQGLCCAAPHSNGLDLILVRGQPLGDNGSGHPQHSEPPPVSTPPSDGDHDVHYARLLVPTECITFKEHIDDVIAIGGKTYFVWRLEGQEVTLSPPTGALVAPVASNDAGLGDAKSPASGQETDVRWIPCITKLAKRKFDERNRHIDAFNWTAVSSVVHLPGGGTFASALAAHSGVWEFGEPAEDTHVIAEHITYKLRYELGQVELTLHKVGEAPKRVTLESEGDEIRIMVSNLPMQGFDLKSHFRYFYTLLEAGGGKPYDGPAPRPKDGEYQLLGLRQCGSARIGTLQKTQGGQ